MMEIKRYESFVRIELESIFKLTCLYMSAKCYAIMSEIIS